MSFILVVVDVTVEATMKPRPWAYPIGESRWSFSERVVASSPREAVEQLKHRVVTELKPRSLELAARFSSPYPGPEVWTPLQDG